MGPKTVFTTHLAAGVYRFKTTLKPHLLHTMKKALVCKRCVSNFDHLIHH